MSDRLHDESLPGMEPPSSVRDDQSAAIRVATVARVRRRSEQLILAAANLEDHLDLRSATGGRPDGAAICQAIDQRKAETASRVAKWFEPFEPFPVIYDDNLKLVSEIADAYLNYAVEPVVVCVPHGVGDGLAHAQLDAKNPLFRKSAISGNLRDDLSKRPNRLRSSFRSDLQRGGHGTSYTSFTHSSQRRNTQLSKSSLLALDEPVAHAPLVRKRNDGRLNGEGDSPLSTARRTGSFAATAARKRDRSRKWVYLLDESLPLTSNVLCQEHSSELGKVYGPMIRFSAATGMRPEEWAALERQDIDRAAGVVHVARTHVEGVTKAYGKTSASVREIPLSAVAVAALDDVPPRLDTRLVFYGPRGAHVNLRNFRRREWRPALEAAGVPSRRIYDLRSTFASQALVAGVSVFELARIMGTSVRMIERHYGTLLQGSGDAIRGKLDAYLEGLGQEKAAEGEAVSAP